MGRSRKPSQLLEMSGAFKKNPNRRRRDIVILEGLMPPPKWFTVDQVTAYQELAENAPDGVLTKADSAYIEITATLLAEFRREPSDFTAARLTILSKCLTKMGMTPIDRLRLAIPAAPLDDENPFDYF